MKTSTEISSIAKHVGYEKAVELTAKAGFDAWDFSMFDMCKFDADIGRVTDRNPRYFGNEYVNFAKELRRVGEENGIVCNQSHAPFPCHFSEMRYFLKKAIECTAIAGGDVCVIHPMNAETAEKNAEMFYDLLEFAKPYGVKIATENMWFWDKEKDQSCFAACATPEDFCKHIDVVNDPYLVACLDLGHAEMRGSDTTAVEMIRKLDHRLKALHIHDNNKWKDSHQIPFSMDIDFPPIVKALKEIGYDGYFTLEADAYLKAFNADNVFEGVKDMANAARRLADMYEAF